MQIKRIRKKIRPRARYLKNDHFRHEAEKVNTYAINKQVEKLFNRAKKSSKQGAEEESEGDDGDDSDDDVGDA